jgi:hypothetical protein
MEATVRRELIAAILTTLLGCNPVFAQVGGVGSATPPTPGMGLTSPFGMSSAAAGGAVGPTGLPLGATELATPGLSPAPPGTLGSGLTICSAVVGAGSGSATGVFDGGGVSSDMSPAATGETNSASAGACNQASGAGSAGTLQSTTAPPGATAPLGIGTIPMGSTELGNAGLSPTPCPLTGPTLPTDGSVTGTGAC